MILVGEPIIFKATLKDSEGNLLSPSAVSFDVKAKGVHTEGLVASQESIGIWTYPYEPQVRGRHIVVVKVDGKPREQEPFFVQSELA